jgi:hypothetical protein
MKKIHFLLLIVATTLILPGCKKIIDSIVPAIPEEPIITAVGTPVGNVVSKVIGKSGGSIVSADGNAELIFPAGALDNDKPISIQAITNNAPNGVGNAYRFLPEGIKFLQPVTLKFHYTAKDLAATLGDLMGIASQDSIGAWYRVNNFINDDNNKIISAPITHFSDWTQFDVMNITPSSATVKVNETTDLMVTYINPGSDDDELAYLTEKVEKITWTASAGSLTGGAGDDKYRVYKAPSKVPSQNPVAVSAQIQIKFKYHGKIFDKTSLVSNITITDGQTYLLEIRQTETADPFVYKDTARLTIIISADGKVTFSDIQNFAPVTTPGTATVYPCTATWIPDNIGEMNITNVTGTISGSPGDPKRDLILQFSHSGTVTPKFSRLCSGGTEEISGGIAMPGFPTLLFFTITPNGGSYFLDDGQEFARLTLQ